MEQAGRIECDVSVVGGGVNGAGIARDAAGRGLSVVLCEKDDLASHTSSAATKLIHGGRPIAPADVVWSYSGVRPLLDDERHRACRRERAGTIRIPSQGTQ